MHYPASPETDGVSAHILRPAKDNGKKVGASSLADLQLVPASISRWKNISHEVQIFQVAKG